MNIRVKCRICKEWYVPTDEQFNQAETTPADWACPACEDVSQQELQLQEGRAVLRGENVEI